MIRILVAEDHNVVRQGLTRILESEEGFEVIGQAEDGEEAYQKAKALTPDILLLDNKMPRLNGIEVTRKVTGEDSEVNVVILTAYPQDEYLFESIKAGAKGYLLKNVDTDELFESIRNVARGEAILDSQMASRMLEEFRRIRGREDDRFAQLTKREKEILNLVAKGAPNQRIANELNISEKTVRNRLTGIYDKLHVNNRTQAAIRALKRRNHFGQNN